MKDMRGGHHREGHQAGCAEELLDEETVKYYINRQDALSWAAMGDTALPEGRSLLTAMAVSEAMEAVPSRKRPDEGRPFRRLYFPYIGEDIVAAGIAEKVEVQLAYAIGVPEPVSILVDTYGSGKIGRNDRKTYQKNFNLTPRESSITCG